MFDRISLWLVSEREESEASRIRVFCFPHAGAGSSAYAGWASKLSENFEVFVVVLPHREHRTSSSEQISFDQMISDLVSTLV